MSNKWIKQFGAVEGYAKADTRTFANLCTSPRLESTTLESL
jgi:hypothetical protein